MCLNFFGFSFLIFMYDVRASKWAQNDPQAKKQLQLLKAHTFTFPMIFIASQYMKKLILSFFMYELKNGLKMTLKPKKQLQILKA